MRSGRYDSHLVAAPETASLRAPAQLGAALRLRAAAPTRKQKSISLEWNRAPWGDVENAGTHMNPALDMTPTINPLLLMLDFTLA